MLRKIGRSLDAYTGVDKMFVGRILFLLGMAFVFLVALYSL